MPEVSIILPTYKPDMKKLAGMIGDVQRQSFRDFELLIVEDGCSDETHSDIQRLTEADARIRLVRQENAGVSSARNRGISLARGKYLAFVDDDDVLSPVFLEESIKAMEETDSDFVIGLIFCETGGKDRSACFAKTDYETRVLEGKALSNFRYDFLEIKEHFTGGAYFGRGPYAKLIRTSAVHARFLEGMGIGEDQIYNLELLNQVKKVALVYRVWYIYMQSPDSVTMRCSPDALECIERLLREVQARVPVGDSPSGLFWGNYLLKSIVIVAQRWFGNKNCPLSQPERIRQLRRLSKKEPWIAAFDRRYLSRATKKNKLIAFLFRIGLLGTVYGAAHRSRNGA